MVYYQVPAALDGYQRNKRDCTTWITGELYTQKELEKLGVNPDKLRRVEASKRNTYYFFGGRFNSDLQQEGETHELRQK